MRDEEQDGTMTGTAAAEQKPAGVKRTLAGEIRALAERFKNRPVLVSEVIQASHGRGYDLFLILLSLPFLTPIPLPLLSTPFGLLICFAGLRLALGQKQWWPKRLLEKKLPPHFFPTLLRGASRVIQGIEYLVKPRFVFFHNTVVFQRLAGALIAISGFLLLLPIPVPFSNTFPALTIVLLASGALENDGLFFLGGCLAFCFSVSYFVLLSMGGAAVLNGVIS